MSEIRRDEIIYEEGWRESAPPAETEKVPIDEAEPEKEQKKQDGSKPLLISIQLVLCLITALALFLLKSMDSDFYRDFMDFYHDELNKPVISQGVFDTVDISKLFGGAPVSAGTDEAADSGD